jgi:hypothetical protein
MSDYVDILNKLFDTLKGASDRNEQATQKLVEQQVILVGKIKSMPIDELRDVLKSHADKTDKEISDCNGTIELRTLEIKDLIKDLITRVNRMILAVTIAVTITTGGYFIIRYMADDHININTLRQELKQERHNEQNEIVKKIQEEMRKLHLEKQSGGPSK